VADTMEARGQDMDQEPANELIRGQARECPIFCVSVIWFMLPDRSKDDDDF